LVEAPVNRGSGSPEARKETVVQSAKMQFIVRGFSQVSGYRVFTFEGIAAGQPRALYSVRANLALTLRYGIRLQDLPLLCREVLERGHEGTDTRTFAYTEQEMRVHADAEAARAEAAKQRKPARRPAAANVGAAWRGPAR
jgi:hypothetical protein